MIRRSSFLGTSQSATVAVMLQGNRVPVDPLDSSNVDGVTHLSVVGSCIAFEFVLNNLRSDIFVGSNARHN